MGRRFAALFGVWQSVPYLIADFLALSKKEDSGQREPLTRVTSAPYRLALTWIALAPIPFAFTGMRELAAALS